MESASRGLQAVVRARIIWSWRCYNTGRRLLKRAGKWDKINFIDIGRLQQQSETRWIMPPTGRMRTMLTGLLAEEAPGAYKDVSDVVEVTERSRLARKVAKLAPLICIKG